MPPVTPKDRPKWDYSAVRKPANPNCLLCDGLGSLGDTGRTLCSACFPGGVRPTTYRAVQRDPVEGDWEFESENPETLVSQLIHARCGAGAIAEAAEIGFEIGKLVGRFGG